MSKVSTQKPLFLAILWQNTLIWSVSPMTHFVFGRKFLGNAVLLMALNPPSSLLALGRFYKRAFLSVSVIYYLKFIVVCYIELRSIQYSLSHPIALCSSTDIKFIILTHDYKASLLLITTLPLLEALSRCSSTRLGSVDNSRYHIEHTWLSWGFVHVNTRWHHP